MSEEFSNEAKQVVLSELNWLQDFLHINFDLPVEKVKRLLRQVFLAWL